MVGRRASISILILRGCGRVEDRFEICPSSVILLVAGAVSDRTGEEPRLDNPLLSPFILCVNFLATLCGMSSKSEVCLVCFRSRTGEVLRLRLRELDDMANEGTFRSPALAEAVRASGDPIDIPSGDPIDTWGDKGAPSLE